MKRILILLILIISCNINAQEDKAYEVLNAVFEQLDNDLKARIKKHPNHQSLKKELGDPIHINPKFSYILVSMSKNTFLKSPDIKNDFWIIDYIPALRNYSEKFQIENLQLIKDPTHYIKQIKKTPNTLDISKITNKRIRHYKTELEVYNNIKQYEHLLEKGVDSITLKKEKESMLGYENKHFRISYPIFSKDNKYALVYIEKNELGMQFWVLQKFDQKWKKVCRGHVGTIN